MGRCLGLQDFAARVQGAGFGEYSHISCILTPMCASLLCLYATRLHLEVLQGLRIRGYMALHVGRVKHA